MPSVSILLPARNEESYLPAALKSLFCQTLSDWELVLVNDGSVDGTAKIMEQAKAQDRRVRVFHRPAEGLAKALNHGLANCRSKIVARMDADDLCHPRRLELQLQHLREHPETALVACKIRHFPRRCITQGLLAYENWQNSLMDQDSIVRDFFVESPFAHPSVMFRRQSVIDAGGYRETAWAEDYDLWLRLLQNGAHFSRRPEPLLYWRDRPKRISRIRHHYTLQAFRACKLHFLRQGFLSDIDQVTLWGAGTEGKAWRKELLRNGIETVRWIDVNPRKIGQFIHDAPVLPIESLSSETGKILVTVGVQGVRQQVRDFAGKYGLVDGRDFICVT